MLIRLIFIIALIAAVWYGYRRIQALPPERRSSLWWTLALGGLVAISLIGLATGRMQWLGAALALLLAGAKYGTQLLFRIWPLLRASGQDAVFRTEHLEVRFVIKTSQLQGIVIKGLHEGKALHTMPAEQLRELANLYQDQDRKSWYLVRVFLQRASAGQTAYQNQSQSQEHHQDSGGFPSSPSRDEALLILGLNGNPDRSEIIAAHRKLIQKLHPDRGGNDYLAARVNQAKDVLLSSQRQQSV
jgi:hypothetical protein